MGWIVRIGDKNRSADSSIKEEVAEQNIEQQEVYKLIVVYSERGGT